MLVKILENIIPAFPISKLFLHHCGRQSTLVSKTDRK